jgi:hypothetical protein
MSFDFIILVVTTVGLLRSPGRSSLWQLLFRHGIVYFAVAFIANLIPTIFVLLNLNCMCFSSPPESYDGHGCKRRSNLPLLNVAVMNLMFNIPAASVSSIVACHLFISLTNFRQHDVYIHSVRPYLPTRVRCEGSGRNVSQAHVGGGHGSDDRLAKKMRNTVAGIAFRVIGEGVDSMSPAHTCSISELGATRTISSLAAVDLRPNLGVNKSGEVVVHADTVRSDGDGGKGDNGANAADLDEVESLTHGEKNFVTEV